MQGEYGRNGGMGEKRTEERGGSMIRRVLWAVRMDGLVSGQSEVDLGRPSCDDWHPVILFPVACSISKQAQSHQGAVQLRKKGSFSMLHM